VQGEKIQIVVYRQQLLIVSTTENGTSQKNEANQRILLALAFCCFDADLAS
jgi:hypothetical protein